MSSMAEGEMMANGPAGTRIGHTTDHTSARSEASEVACGKRRRSWTAEQKRQIVAESLVPGASAAAVARKHGISSGQFYAWRQQLLLSGTFDAAADARPTAVPADEPAAASFPEAAVLAAPPEAEIMPLCCGVSAPMPDCSGIEEAPASNHAGALNDTIAARPVCVRADGSHGAEPDGAVRYALRRFRPGDRSGRPPVRPVRLSGTEK
jgi:transposase